MPKFKGGTYVDEKGYLRISAGKHRNVRVATLVAEAKLGRKLLPTEDVHHVDEDKLNPEWTNIEVIDHSLHGWVSAAQGQFMKRKEAKDKAQWNEYFSEQETDKREALSSANSVLGFHSSERSGLPRRKHSQVRNATSKEKRIDRSKKSRALLGKADRSRKEESKA